MSVLYVHTPLRPLSFSVGASAPIVDVLKEVQRELPALSECGARCGLYPVLRLMMYTSKRKPSRYVRVFARCGTYQVFLSNDVF